MELEEDFFPLDPLVPLFHDTISFGAGHFSLYFIVSNHPKCLRRGTILYHVIVQHLAQPLLEEVEQRSLGILIRALAHLRQEPAGNLSSRLL